MYRMTASMEYADATRDYRISAQASRRATGHALILGNIIQALQVAEDCREYGIDLDVGEDIRAMLQDWMANNPEVSEDEADPLGDDDSYDGCDDEGEY